MLEFVRLYGSQLSAIGAALVFMFSAYKYLHDRARYMKYFFKPLIFILFLLPCTFASASSLDECGVKQSAAIWAAFRTPGFAADKASIRKNFPLPGSKLFNASAFGYDELVLEEVRRNPNSVEAAKALSTAAAIGRLTTTALLLGAGVSPNAQIENGLTPLYAAAQEGCSEEIIYLVGLGADTNYHAKVPESILELAISMRHFDTAKTLVKLGYQASKEERTAIMKMLVEEDRKSIYHDLFN